MIKVERSECVSRWVYALAFGTVWATLFSMFRMFGPEGLIDESQVKMFAPVTGAVIGGCFPFVRRPHPGFRLISAALVYLSVFIAVHILILQLATLFTIILTVINWSAIYGKDGLKESLSTWYGKVSWTEEFGDGDGTRQFFF